MPFSTPFLWLCLPFSTHCPGEGPAAKSSAVKLDRVTEVLAGGSVLVRRHHRHRVLPCAVPNLQLSLEHRFLFLCPSCPPRQIPSLPVSQGLPRSNASLSTRPFAFRINYRITPVQGIYTYLNMRGVSTDTYTCAQDLEIFTRVQGIYTCVEYLQIPRSMQSIHSYLRIYVKHLHIVIHMQGIYKYLHTCGVPTDAYKHAKHLPTSTHTGSILT